MNQNLKKIQFLQRQIRLYLQSKKKENNKLFNRPQNKSKNNYLFLNSDGANEIEKKTSVGENNFRSQNDKEIETQGEMDRNRLNNQDEDSFLNNEIR